MNQSVFVAIDPQALPALPITERASLPPVPAIYFVTSEKKGCLYIGSTWCLRERWMGHHKLWQLLEEDSNAAIAWFECDSQLLGSIENTLIAKFRPLLNQPPRKSGNPDYASMTAYIPRPLRREVKKKLLDLGIDYSQLTEQLLKAWLEPPKA
jgi:hypothetical protein